MTTSYLRIYFKDNIDLQLSMDYILNLEKINISFDRQNRTIQKY